LNIFSEVKFLEENLNELIKNSDKIQKIKKAEKACDNLKNLQRNARIKKKKKN